MIKNNSLFDLSNQVTVVTGGGGVLCAEMCIALASVGCLAGTILSCQVYGKYFSKVRKGNIINIASINAIRPLTRIPAYSAAKAAVGNFTQWLAVHMAQEYSPEIRVNAIVPGFFLSKQNRYLLKNEATDEWTPRAIQILTHTSLGRFGKPEDLTGVLLWLASSASEYVTGTLIPIDGGFSAYSGV